MAVYDPALMLQSGADGSLSLVAVVYVVVKTVLAIALWGAAAIGFLRTRLNIVERLFAFVAASFLVAAAPWTDYVGFALSVVSIAWQFWQARRPEAATAS
jgi:TRAP-type uncharacterized transport system fused permease subunit